MGELLLFQTAERSPDVASRFAASYEFLRSTQMLVRSSTFKDV